MAARIRKGMETRMTARISVRRAMRSDLAAIRKIEESSFSRPWKSETFDELLGAPGMDVLVAVAGGGVAGYAVLAIREREAELANLAVSAPHRGEGIGRILVEHAVEVCRERGVRRALLAVRASNLGAIRLYRHYGFRVIGSHASYYEDPSEDACIMLLTLPQEC